jgi:acetoin utilization deacetylase AcuC-like enzyme
LIPTPRQIEPALASPVLVVAEEHHVHRVRDRGYLERPARVDALLAGLPAGLFQRVQPHRFGESPIRAVHDADFVRYLRTIGEKADPKESLYPFVFAVRNRDRLPRDIEARAGWYAMDGFTPLDCNAYRAARGAVDAALTAADELLRRGGAAYALCRPPGHHAERRIYGGFCYFNNAAIAAQRLSRRGTVAILDIDFHHGNGTQDIFWRRSDVLTLSIHGHPDFAYPYFSGFEDEVGEGPGRGFNANYPLPLGTGEAAYLKALGRALGRIEQFCPTFLVVALGFDTMKADPTGGFVLDPATMGEIGRRLAALRLPTLIVQEGGYVLRNLRAGARTFFRGFFQGKRREQGVSLSVGCV